MLFYYIAMFLLSVIMLLGIGYIIRYYMHNKNNKTDNDSFKRIQGKENK